jgi:hypothetical protein
MSPQAGVGPSQKTDPIAAGAEAGAAPQVAGAQLTVAELVDQLGLAQSALGTAAAEAQQQKGYQLAQAGISQQQLGLQGQALSDQQLLEFGQLARQGQGIEASRGLTKEQFDLEQAALTQQTALTQQENQAAVQSLQAQQAASGVAQSRGQTQAQQIQAAQQQYQQAQLARQAQGEKAQYDYQMGQYDREKANLDAQTAYSTSDFARGQAALGLAAQQNGLSVQQTIDQLKYGLAQQGIQERQTEADLFGQIGQAVAGGESAAAGVLGIGALTGGLNLNSILAGGS